MLQEWSNKAKKKNPTNQQTQTGKKKLVKELVFFFKGF